MPALLTTTLAAAWSRKRRLAGTALAIVLGVTFLTATLVLGDTARAGFRSAFAEANEGTDAVVRSATAYTGGEETVRPPVDAALLDTVLAVDGVEAAVATVEGTAQVLDADGDPIGGNGPPTMGGNWIDHPDLAAWELAAGRAPAAPGEVVLDVATAEDAGVGPGDTVTVLVPGPLEVTVVGTATFGGDDGGIGGTTYVAFTTEEAQARLLGRPDAVSAVAVAAVDGVDQEELVARLAPVLPEGVEAITGRALTDEQQADIESDFLGFFTTALLAFAVIALLVAAFSIVNTFSILAAQRTRESALLRALGASRAQVLGSTVIEAALVGAVGSLAGAAAGVGGAAGLLALLDHAGFGLPTDGLEVTGGALAVVVLVGMAVTLVGALAPAVRASRVAPLAALRDVAVDGSAGSRWRALVGLVAAAGGAALVVTAAAGNDGEGGAAMARAGMGGLVLMVGAVLLGPVLARPLASVLGAPLRLRGVSGELARRNAVRNPKRTAATAAALVVGVGVVSLFTVVAASVKASVEDAVDRAFGGDLVVTPAVGSWSGAGLGTDTVDALAALPEVEAAAGIGSGPATVDGRHTSVDVADPRALAAVADLDVVEGDLASMGQHDLAVTVDHAEERGWQLGDRVEVGFPDGATETLTVAATFDERFIAGPVLVSDTLWRAHDPQPAAWTVLVGLADGVSLDDGRAAIEAVTAGAGAPDVMDRDEFVESQAAEVDAFLAVVYGLLAVAILIALMGIANTLSLSVHERTRELGLLRAVGQTRAQLRAMVRWESVLVSGFGAVVGVALGLFLGWGLIRALDAAEGIGTLAVPVGPMAVVLAVGAGVGVLAGLRPAWRASRLDVLAAVAAE